MISRRNYDSPDYTDDLTLLTNTSAQYGSPMNSQEQAAGSINLCVNANKPEVLCFKWEGSISTLVDEFIYLSSNISSTESDVNICLAKVWNAIKRKLDPSDRIKQDCFQAVTVSLLLYKWTTWKLTKYTKKLDGDSTKILSAVLKKFCWQNHTKQQLFSHQPPISQSMLGTAGKIKTYS